MLRHAVWRLTAGHFRLNAAFMKNSRKPGACQDKKDKHRDIQPGILYQEFLHDAELFNMCANQVNGQASQIYMIGAVISQICHMYNANHSQFREKLHTDSAKIRKPLQ